MIIITIINTLDIFWDLISFKNPMVQFNANYGCYRPRWQRFRVFPRTTQIHNKHVWLLLTHSLQYRKVQAHANDVCASPLCYLGIWKQKWKLPTPASLGSPLSWWSHFLNKIWAAFVSKGVSAASVTSQPFPTSDTRMQSMKKKKPQLSTQRSHQCVSA